MVSVFDVASYILQKQGPMTTMKLQKLVYYCQAWSLVWHEKPLFPETIKAWANGPVVPDLYWKHKGMFVIAPGEIAGDPSSLSKANREACDSVLAFYGNHSSQWLSELTHMEDPWREARLGTPFNDRSPEITHASMAEYYASL